MSQREYQEIIHPDTEGVSDAAVEAAEWLACTGRTLIRMGRDGWQVHREGTCDTRYFKTLPEVRAYAMEVRR
tara:strand:+ start:2006 stop:2221 length:216 start_codon:yes stop_codon:yes gene_type:complete